MSASVGAAVVSAVDALRTTLINAINSVADRLDEQSKDAENDNGTGTVTMTTFKRVDRLRRRQPQVYRALLQLHARLLAEQKITRTGRLKSSAHKDAVLALARQTIPN